MLPQHINLSPRMGLAARQIIKVSIDIRIEFDYYYYSTFSEIKKIFVFHGKLSTSFHLAKGIPHLVRIDLQAQPHIVYITIGCLVGPQAKN